MYFNTDKYDVESKSILELNEFIHGENEMAAYHMSHINLVRKYALLLNKRMGYNLNNQKLSYIALAHDLFKERSLDPSKTDVTWKGYEIPQDTKRYVRTHLETLEKFGLDDYFNSDMQYHALSAGIFLNTELWINDPEILYPIFFHSCPVISVYETLPLKTQRMVDVIMLSDKLSSNWLRINERETPVVLDLDLAVFGANGRELNFTLGLYLARIISQGKSIERESTVASKYFYKRLTAMNPIVAKHCPIKKIGGAEVWPKRRSQAFRTG